jgi:hypothetical protein
VLGDCYPDHPKIGVFDLNLTLHYFPKDKVLYALRNTPVDTYVTDLDATIKFNDPTNPDRYIQFSFDKLYLEEHPMGIPSKDDAIYGVDAVFKLTPAGSLTVEEENDLGIEHYEGSYKE